MTERDQVIWDAIKETPWHSWNRSPASADASARRYFRLADSQGKTVILADVPPKTEDFRRFLDVADTLHKAGLCVPRPLWQNHDIGAFILTDLGERTFSYWVSENPAQTTEMNDAVVDILMIVRGIPTSLSDTLDKNRAVEMLEPLFEFYGATGKQVIENALAASFDRFVQSDPCMSLRDFHAENLIWRDSETGTDQLGVLDFQDAFMAPEGYDLASFTRDVRRDVSRKEQLGLESKMAVRLKLPIQEFRQQIVVLAIQRNLRILGVFAKLIASGKPHYAQFLPRVWAYIVQDLEIVGDVDLSCAIHANVTRPDQWIGAQL